MLPENVSNISNLSNVANIYQNVSNCQMYQVYQICEICQNVWKCVCRGGAVACSICHIPGLCVDVACKCFKYIKFVKCGKYISKCIKLSNVSSISDLWNLPKCMKMCM